MTRTRKLVAMCVVVAISLCRGQTPGTHNVTEIIDVKYLGDREPAVSVVIPAVALETGGVTVGDGLTVEVGEKTKIKLCSTSVFTDEFRKKLDPTTSTQTLRVRFAENYSSDEHTKSFALSIGVSGGGFWGSASAHYNQENFERLFHNKLVAETSLISDASTNTLRDVISTRDLRIFKQDVIDMINRARAAFDKGDSDALAKERHDFALTYGNGYVFEEHLGAQLVVQASQELSTRDTIEKQTSDFSVSTGGLSAALSKASADASVKKEVKESIKKTSVNYSAFLQGAGGKVFLGDRDKIIEFVNQGIDGKGWFETAQQNPPRLTITASNYSAIPALAILTQPSGALSALHGTRELIKSRIYPVMDGKENVDYAAAATFLQIPNGFGMLDYVWVPLPRPDGAIAIDDKRGIATMRIKVPRFSDPKMLELIAARWKEAKANELGGDRSDDRLYFQTIDRPKMLGRGTLVYELEYSPDVAEVDRLTLSGGHGDTYSQYPPNIEALHNRYPEFDQDAYSFEYSGSPQAAQKFKAMITTSGIRIRPVVEANAQRIKLGAFEVKTDANGNILRPKRIEDIQTSDALRRLQALDVWKESLRIKRQAKISAAPATFTHVATVPGYWKVRVVASGKFSLWAGRAPFCDADYDGGSLRYNVEPGKKCGVVWIWENKAGSVADVTAQVFDPGTRNGNQGVLTLDAEMVPIGAPFDPLPDAVEKDQEAKKK